jgi:hypothetical protein
MQLEHAKDENESTTLKAAKRSDWTIYGLFILLAVAGVGWANASPTAKEKITAGVGAAAVPILFVLKNFNTSIKDVGDLNEAVKNYALFSAAEGIRVDNLKPVIEGRLQLHELPEVQQKIEAEVKTRLAQINPVQTFITSPAEGVALAPVPMGTVSHYAPNASPPPKPGLDGWAGSTLQAPMPNSGRLITQAKEFFVDVT